MNSPLGPKGPNLLLRNAYSASSRTAEKDDLHSGVDVRTRPASSEDLPRCLSIISEALDDIRGRRGGDLHLLGLDGFVGPEFSSAAELLDAWSTPNAQTALMVGTLEGVVAGIAAGAVVQTDELRLGRIRSLYVSQGSRRAGVGAALLADILAWFSERGCSGADASALPGDRPMKQLLESAGLKARLLVLHRSLP